MRKLFYLLLIGAAIYGVARYVPQETKHQALAAVGLSDFFSETLPRYVRHKLSIPQNPVRQREKLLGELSGTIERIDRELESLAPPESGTRRTSRSATPPPQEIRERVAKTRELLAQSELFLGELVKANPGQSVLEKAAERLLDAMLPQAAESGGGGVGGDSSGGAICPPQ